MASSFAVVVVRAFLKKLLPLVSLIGILAFILREYELPAEHLRVDEQAVIHKQIGDSLFMDIMPFTVAMSSAADKSQCLWKYDTGAFFTRVGFCSWYYANADFAPHYHTCDTTNFMQPFTNSTILDYYSALYASDYIAYYESQLCSDCFPPDKADEIGGLPRIDSDADSKAVGLYYNSVASFALGRPNFTPKCDESIKAVALNGWCVYTVCPLTTPTIKQVDHCRFHTQDLTRAKDLKFNNSCLTNRQDCPNCDRLRHSANVPELGVNIQFAEVFTSFKYVYDSSVPPEYFNWDWRGSIFFATTIVTTIGYGSFSPVTDGGKAWLVVLSIPMIGLFGYCLSEAMGHIVQAISVTCTVLKEKVLCRKSR
jgi:hypothetical protein